ncbi:MAG: DUF3187 family protein [Granulosicoccus sp.]
MFQIPIPEFTRAAIVLLIVTLPLDAYSVDDISGYPRQTESPLIQQRILHPVNTLFGLPAVASRPVAASEWQISLEHGNVFMGGDDSDESLILDGESSELALRYRRRLGSCWQAEVAGSIVAHSRGHFDRAIDNWHQLFGLPDANREEFDYFGLEYGFSSGADSTDTRPVLRKPVEGLGDTQLAVQRTLLCNAAQHTTSSITPQAGTQAALLRFGIKVPTGLAAVWLGSGATDIWFDLQSPVMAVGPFFRYAATAGILLPGKIDDMGDQKPLTGFGSLGLQYRWRPRLSFILQADWHTAFFESSLTELGEFATRASLAARYVTHAQQLIELSISEDAVIDTAPDIVARIALTWRVGN